MIIIRPRYVEPGQEPGSTVQGFWERIFGYKPRYVLPPDRTSPDEPPPDEPSNEDRESPGSDPAQARASNGQG